MALSFLAKLLLTGNLKFENGEIKLKGMNLIMLPSIHLYNLTKYFLEKNKLYVLYLISWLSGLFVTYNLIKIFRPKNPEQIYSLGMDFVEGIGIGIYKTHEYYPGRYTHFIIYNNPFAKWFEPHQKPIDYFISGIMAGGGCFVHDSLCQNIELKCIAKGDNCCEFLTGTKEELERRKLWEIVEERYNLKEILPIQEVAYKNIDKSDEKELVNELLKMVAKL